MNNILDEVIVHIEQNSKTCWIIKSKAFSCLWKKNCLNGRVFDFVYKTLDLNELKCKLKSVYTVDFAKQVSSIQEVREIIGKL